MVADRREPDQARAELYEIMREDAPFEEKAARALELGAAYLNVQNAHLTHIDVKTDFWEAIASTDPPDGDFPAGEVLDLQTSYCRRAAERRSSIALHNAPEQGWADDPAFETHRLHTYHGTPLIINDDVIGTVCFVSEDPRDEPFAETETTFAELIARMLEDELKHTRLQDSLDMQAGLISVLSRVLRHNLRNDLNVVRGYLANIAEGVSETDGLERVALDKINDLIDLANTAREFESIALSELQRQPIELDTLVHHVVRRAQTDYPEASFTVDSSGEVTTTALPTLRNAISEVVENAAKHSGPDPSVTVVIEETSEKMGVLKRSNSVV